VNDVTVEERRLIGQAGKEKLPIFLDQYNIILPSTSRFPSCLSPSGFLTKAVNAHLYFPPKWASRTALFIVLDFIAQIIFGDEYKSWSSSLRSLLHSSFSSSLLDPNIFLSTLVSKTFSLRSSVNLRDPIFTPIQNHKQNCFMFLDSKLDYKIFLTEFGNKFNYKNLFCKKSRADWTQCVIFHLPCI